MCVCVRRYLGRQVGLFNASFDYHVGDWQASGTRQNRGIKRKRSMIEDRNSIFHQRMYGPKDQGERTHARERTPARARAYHGRIRQHARALTLVTCASDTDSDADISIRHFHPHAMR